MKKLDMEQSVRAIFVLCSDVSRLTVNGESYLYFKPERRSDAKIIKYIFKNNDIKSEKHLTHYYTTSNAVDLIVRVPISEMDFCSLTFKQYMDVAYKNKADFAGGKLVKSDRKPVLFGLWPASKKQKFINTSFFP